MTFMEVEACDIEPLDLVPPGDLRVRGVSFSYDQGMIILDVGVAYLTAEGELDWVYSTTRRSPPFDKISIVRGHPVPEG